MDLAPGPASPESRRPSVSDPPPAAVGARELALAVLGSHAGMAMVDFDETLYLRNSTEDFLESARPRLLALLLLRALEILGPWRFVGGRASRDVWRIALVGVVFPWTWLAWRLRVKTLAAQYTNRELLAALDARREPWCVVTDGFRPIVSPLGKAMGLAHRRLVACEVSAGDRSRGKLARASRALGPETVAAALFLTDSEADRPLLDACAAPYLVTWPGALHRRALCPAYLPGLYTARVKHPGGEILHGILLEDFAFWLLASWAVATNPLAHTAGLLALLVSFWAIYERGYVDNDVVASRFESDPVLTPAFFRNEAATPPLQPWCWAFAFGAIGLVLLRLPEAPSWRDGLSWTAVLGLTFALFHVYNRVSKDARVWLYLGLQVARACSFMALVPVTALGASALAAHALARWLKYVVYRSGSASWPRMSMPLARLLVFLTLAGVAIAADPGLARSDRGTFALVVLWCVYRARRDLASAVATTRWLPARAARRAAEEHDLAAR